jgi:hypothetical protein
MTKPDWVPTEVDAETMQRMHEQIIRLLHANDVRITPTQFILLGVVASIMRNGVDPVPDEEILATSNAILTTILSDLGAHDERKPTKRCPTTKPQSMNYSRTTSSAGSNNADSPA